MVKIYRFYLMQNNVFNNSAKFSKVGKQSSWHLNICHCIVDLSMMKMSITVKVQCIIHRVFLVGRLYSLHIWVWYKWFTILSSFFLVILPQDYERSATFCLNLEHFTRKTFVYLKFWISCKLLRPYLLETKTFQIDMNYKYIQRLHICCFCKFVVIKKFYKISLPFRPSSIPLKYCL